MRIQANNKPAGIRPLPVSLSTILLMSLLFLFCSCGESPEQLHQRLDAEAQQYVARQQYTMAIATWKNLLSRQPGATDIYPRLAKAYELNGQYRDAITSYQKHLATHPDSQEALTEIMKMQLRLHDTAGARATWKHLKQFPPRPKPLLLHADLIALEGHNNRAIEEYKKVLALDTGNQVALARLAVLLLGERKDAEAAGFYQTLEKLHPTDPAILLQMGNYWLLSGDSSKAGTFLEQALALAPDNRALQLKLAELHLNSGRFAEAAAIYTKLLKVSPHSRYYKKMLLECLLQEKHFSQAEDLLTALSSAENQDVDFLLLKGKYYLNTGKYLIAASQFELALEKEPRLPLAHYFLALAYLANGQNCLGQQSLIKALNLNPNFTAAELTLADTYYKTGNYDLALEHVSRIRKREPENPRPLLLQGILLHAKQKYPESLAAFQKAFLLNPDTNAALYFSGIVYDSTGDTKQALTLFRSLLARQPSLMDATLLYCQLLRKQEQPTVALHYIDKALSRQPNQAYLHHIAGLILLDAGKRQKAIKEFQTALHLMPGLKESYLQLFNIYRNNQTSLQNTLEQAIQHVKGFEEAAIKLASIYIKNNDPDKAISLLEEFLAKNPDSPILSNNLAWLYLLHKPSNIDDAMRLASLAYDRLPDNAAIADTLGWIYYKKNLFQRAEWLLEEAAEKSPDNRRIHAHLSEVHGK
ncbi:tetratricopeptide repeat protein [Thermodesulfobacteriota bacterium B35]